MIKLLSLIVALAALASADSPVGFQTRYIRLGQQDTSSVITADAAGNIFILSALAAGGSRVTKADPQGNVVGSFDFNSPSAVGMAVDGDGNLVMVGSIFAPASGFVAFSFGSAACVFKIDAAMTQILTSRCMGDSTTSGSAALAVAVDSANNVYVAGSTWDPNFPVTPGAYQTTPPVGDLRSGPGLTATFAFVAKLTPDLSTLVYSTFFGNSSLDCITEVCYRHYATTAPVGIAVDATGVVTIAGNSDSPLLVDPSAGVVVEGPFAYGFAAKFSADGSSLLGFSAMSVYSASNPLGLYSNAVKGGMAVDPDGNVMVLSSSSTFNFGPNAVQPTSSGGGLVVVKYDATLQNVLWGTYFGDGLAEIALDGNGSLWVSGSSTISKLPGSNSSSTQVSTYVGEISADGSTLLGLTLTGNQGGYAMACRASGLIAVLGQSDSFLLAVPPDQSALLTVASSANSVSSGTIAPAELISLFGNGIGPAMQLSGQVVDGVYTSNLGGYQVLFNGAPAPLLYAGPDQINVVTPMAVSGQSTASITVVGPRGAIQFPTVFVAPARPQIFSQSNPAGAGAPSAVAFNEDGTLNTAANPATLGSTVTLLVTGLGLAGQQSVDGAISTAAQPIAALAVSTVTTALTSLGVQYVGDVPGFVLGVAEIEIQLPSVPFSSTVAVQAGGSTSAYANIYVSGT